LTHHPLSFCISFILYFTRSVFQSAVRSLSESSAEVVIAKSAAEEDARVLRENLIKREKKLSTLVKDNAELQTQLDDATHEMSALRKRHEKTRKDLKANEESLKAARAELDRVQAENQRGRDAKVLLEADLASSRTFLVDNKAQLATLQEIHAVSINELAERVSAMAILEEAIAIASARIEESKVEHTIGLRLTRQLNRELKAQLGAESRRSAKLERELAAVTKGVNAKGAKYYCHSYLLGNVLFNVIIHIYRTSLKL
jgi:septal ring factor EnvC (AmiA/AmiB activator)